jgi:hypothetical protein
MAKYVKRQVTDDEIKDKALLVVRAYPTKGASWKHITGTAGTFLRECGMQASPADVERVVKSMNLPRKSIDGEERVFMPKAMRR